MAATVVWNRQREKWQFIYRPPNGGKREVQILGPAESDKLQGLEYAAKRNAADAALRECRASLRPDLPLWGEAAMRAFWASAHKTYADSTYESHGRILELQLIPFFGKKDLRKLKGQDIKDFAAERARPKERGGHGNAYETIQGALRLLRRVLGWCMDENLLDKLPVQSMGKIGGQAASQLTRKEKRAQAWTPQEISALLEISKASPALHALCFTAINSGMRQGELFALTWDCVNFSDSTVLVRESQQRRPPKKSARYYEGELTVKPPKSGAERPVHIGPELCAFLRELQRSRFRRRPFDEGLGMQRVLLNEGGKSWSASGLNSAWKRLRKLIVPKGVRALGFHCLRHTYASILLREPGADIAWVAQQIGDRMDTLLDHYAHFIPEKKEGRLSALSFTANTSGAAASVAASGPRS